MFKDALNVRHPFLRPLWRRVLIVVLCVGWAGVEYWNGGYGWAAAVGLVTAYLIWEFFIVFDPENYAEARSVDGTETMPDE